MEEGLRLTFNCPKCGSSQTTYRIKTEDRICYKCGNIYREEDKK